MVEETTSVTDTRETEKMTTFKDLMLQKNFPLSATAIETGLQCKLRFYRSYVADDLRNLRKQGELEWDAAGLVGTYTHDAVSSWIKQAIPGSFQSVSLSKLFSYIPSFVSVQRQFSSAEIMGMDAKVREHLRSIHSFVLTNGLHKYLLVSSESYERPVFLCGLRCSIKYDLVLYNQMNGTHIIVDWKTGKKSGVKDLTNSVQSRLYYWSFQQNNPDAKVHLLFFYSSGSVALEPECPDGNTEYLQSLVESVVLTEVTDSIEPSPQYMTCGYCPFSPHNYNGMDACEHSCRL